jgi:hypothetical protein
MNRLIAFLIAVALLSMYLSAAALAVPYDPGFGG